MIDHNRLGRELELFHSDPLVGAGLPMWLPAGAAARHAVEEYLREQERLAGYQHVVSPPLGKRELYEKSGHLGHFGEDMFPPMALSADDEFLLRPSLCPHHALMFRARGRSYRDLPLRMAELGGQYRAERSGVLGGLNRVRAMQLNDAHIFCAPDQLDEEIAHALSLMDRVHRALGVRRSSVRLSLRGPGGSYAGHPDAWARADAALRAGLERIGAEYDEAPGEAAFYAPKIDIQVRYAAGREDTLATVQVDFYQPERFDLSYVAAGGERVRPVIVHRSLAGSMERLFAHLIEVHDGAFPAWYAPVQLAVLPVGPGQAGAARELMRAAAVAGLRVRVVADGSLASRIRDAAQARIPYVGVLGDREVPDGSVSLRLRDGRALEPMPVEAAIRLIAAPPEPAVLQPVPI